MPSIAILNQIPSIKYWCVTAAAQHTLHQLSFSFRIAISNNGALRQQPNTPYINLAFHLGLLYLDRHSDR